MKTIRVLLIVILFSLVIAGDSHSVIAQSSDSVYVTETGHWIWGDFLTTYNSVPDPLLYFGYPITDDFVDPVTQQHVQYFQRARLDMITTAESTSVQIAPLGELLHESGGQPADIPNEGPTCREFDTGFSVCYAFLQFYDANDGSIWFGSPISSVELEDGHYVQYFRFARLEWWPDRPSGERVVLSDLGRIYFDKVVANPALLQPNSSAISAEALINPIVHVFALRSLIGAGEQQTIFVVVQDQLLNPVPNAQVGITLFYPDDTREFYILSETNQFGASQLTFTTSISPVETVVNVNAEINISGETASGKTRYRIWW